MESRTVYQQNRTAQAEVLRLRATIEVLLDACAAINTQDHPAAVLVAENGDLAFDLVGQFLEAVRSGDSPCDALDMVWAATGREVPTNTAQG